MAQPQIKSKLESPELTTNQSQAVQLRLSQCLASDPQHIKPKREGGASGDHVHSATASAGAQSRWRWSK